MAREPLDVALELFPVVMFLAAMMLVAGLLSGRRGR